MSIKVAASLLKELKNFLQTANCSLRFTESQALTCRTSSVAQRTSTLTGWQSSSFWKRSWITPRLGLRMSFRIRFRKNPAWNRETGRSSGTCLTSWTHLGRGLSKRENCCTRWKRYQRVSNSSNARSLTSPTSTSSTLLVRCYLSWSTK